MDLNKIGLFRLMSDKMAWHNQRQEVLSQNVANADTPGYAAREIAAFDFKKQLRASSQLMPVADRPGHLSGTLSKGGTFQEQRERQPYETAPDGNGVVLEEQMMKVGQNSMEYQTVTNLYRKQVGLLKTALGSGRQ